MANSCIPGGGGDGKLEDEGSFAPNIPTLRGIVDSAKSFLESVTQLVSTSSVLDGVESELLELCGRLRAACSGIEPLVGWNSSAATTAGQQTLSDENMCAYAPRMLVLGQAKSGKSSLINEILGKTAISQSQSPSFVSELARLRYSPQAASSSLTTTQNVRDGNNVAQELPVLEVSLPCELLKRSGLEILDSPGSQDSPPVDAWGALSASPAVIAYVIDASSGFTREVERDINEIRYRYPSSQLTFILNKMDTCAEIAAATGMTIDMAQTAVRDCTLAGLMRLGFPAAATSEAPGPSFGASQCQLFSLSCRWLRSVRRGLRLDCDADGADNAIVWQESLRTLRVDIACGVGRRLRRLVTEAADRLDDAASLLGKLEIQLDNTDESKRKAWENIVDLQQKSFKELRTCSSLPDRMVAMLKEKGTKRQIIESLRCLADGSDEPPQKSQQAVVVADIERQVFNLQLQFCQKFAETELNDRLARLDDVLGSLNAFQHPMPPTPAPELSREFSMSEGLEFEKLERTPVKKGKSKTLLRSVGIAKQRWRVDAAKEFMCSVDLSPAIRQSTDKLAALMHKAERDTNTAVSRANLRVSEFRDQLKVRRQGVIEQRQEAVKLWLRLHSVITETQLLSKFHWDRRVCIAVGAQGSVVYRVVESNADGTEGRSMAVKKIVLNDEQFSEMAFGLRGNCLSNSDSVLTIQGLVVKQLSSQPAIWKLHLWMDLMMELSLQHQLTYLLEHKSLTERLGILLKITQSLMQVQSDMRQHGNLCLSNVFLCKDGETVKLSDIGQARANRRNQQLTPENQLSGPATCPVDANKVADTDVYSLGLILKAICYGNEPSSTGNSACEDLNKLTEDCVHPLPDSWPKVSEVADRLKKILGQAETPIPS